MKSDSQSAYPSQVSPASEGSGAHASGAKEQNLRRGTLAASLTALASALLWAVVSVSTGYKISFLAVGVGLLVGMTMRRYGKGIDKVFGIIGGLLTLAGCLGGVLLGVIGTIAQAQSISYLAVLSYFDLSVLGKLLINKFRPVDFFFYGVALYEGYLFSFRKIPQE
jgi:hypothetical protein